MPTLLLSNDDGVHAQGLRALAAALRPLGEVVIVAPEVDQSAVSHSMSLRRPLRLNRHKDMDTPHGSVRVYSVDGTPTDCVYMAVNHVLKDQRIDLVASGINHGANLSTDILYSGTVSAAMEGVFLGLPAVAFSLVANHSEDFGPAAQFAHALCKQLLHKGLPKDTLLNVNIPKKITQPGYAVTGVGRHEYTNVVEARIDPRDRPYYWIGGKWNGFQDVPGSDCKAIAEGRISLTPIEVKLTCDRLLPWAMDLNLDNFPAVAAYTENATEQLR